MEHSKANTNENNVKQTTSNDIPDWTKPPTPWLGIRPATPEDLKRDAERKKALKQKEYTCNLANVEPSHWRRINRGRDAVIRHQIANGERKDPFYIAWKCEGNPIYNTHRPRGKKMTSDCGQWSYKKAKELPETAHADGRRAMAICQHCKKKASLVSRPYLILDSKLDAKTFVEGVHNHKAGLKKTYGKWLDE